MKSIEGNIEIGRLGGSLLQVSVIMPFWDKVMDSGVLDIQIPLMGIGTVAHDHNDADIAIKEAIECFCLQSERFGKGLEAELKSLGWVIDTQTHKSTSMLFKVSSRNAPVEQILRTGEQIAQRLDLQIA